jgi:predicted DNA-binding ribbon-helix-helix protein
MPALRKRSVLLSGHATSIALEPEFWAVLEDMAKARGASLAGLIGRIDAQRGERPLASACRVAALGFAQEPAKPTGRAAAPGR